MTLWGGGLRRRTVGAIDKLTKQNGDDRIDADWQPVGASLVGPLAQLVEHLPFKQGVVRSSRTRPIFLCSWPVLQPGKYHKSYFS